MMRVLFGAMAFSIGLAGLAHAADPVALKPEDVVAARQATFTLQQGVFNAMKATIDAGGSLKPLELGADGLTKWGHAIPTMFPAGTNIPPTHAKAEVWSDSAGFAKAAANFADAATKLLAAVRADDKAAFAAQYTATGQTCGACHRTYRERIG